MERPTITRLTLFVPGRQSSLEAWEAALATEGLSLAAGKLSAPQLEGPLEVEWIPNDGEFGAAFSFGTVEPEQVAAIDAAPSALVLRSPVDLREGREALVSIVSALQAAGGLAVRIEQSKAGWEISRWLELYSSDEAFTWHDGGVAFLWGEQELQSCGMHAFSLPDVHLSISGAESDEDRAQLSRFGMILNAYQIGEDPLLFSGHTFSPDAESPRRVLERWPDLNYPEDHACHNPYGVWRVGPPGGSAREGPDLIPVFMPPLWVLLEAKSDQAGGSALRRQAVEALRDEAPCIAMEPVRAQILERSRGYADLNPEFVWEQWQALEESRAREA